MLESPIRPAMRSPLQQALDRIGSAPAVWTPATLLFPSNQTIFTAGVANTITASRNSTIEADGVGIGSATPSLSWTPGTIDLDVDLTAVDGAAGPSVKVAVAAANGMTQDLTSWSPSGLTVVGGEADADGGTAAYKLTASSGAGSKLISRSPSPVMANQETSWEWIVKAGTHSIVALYDVGTHNQVAYLDIATGQANCNRLSCKVVEDLGGGWKRIWAKANGDGAEVTKMNTMRLYLAGSMTGLSLTAAGTETVYAYRPRSVDGPLPLTNYQRCGFRRNGSTAFGAERWSLTTPFNRAVADMAQTDLYVDVLLPDTYSASNQYRVIYLMPVEAGNGTTQNNELEEVHSLGLHNSMDCIFVRPYFYQTRTWGGVKNDGTRDHDAYISDMLPGFMDEFYSTIATREGRTIFGYSAGGFAALTQAQRRPDVWGYCCAWDGPWTALYTAYDQADHFGTEAQYNLFHPYQNFAALKSAFTDKARLIVGGSVTFASDTTSMYSRLVTELGNPLNNGGGDYATTITDADGKWWKLNKTETAHDFIPGWVTPAMAALQVLWAR